MWDADSGALGRRVIRCNNDEYPRCQARPRNRADLRAAAAAAARAAALFDDQVDGAVDPGAARRTGARLAGPRRRAGLPGQRLALPEPRRHARHARPPASREAAALFARRDGDAGHHRLPAAGDARRHRRHPRRHRQHPDHQAARRPRLDRGHRQPRGAGPPGAVRHHAPVPRRPRPGAARPVARAAGSDRRRAGGRPAGSPGRRPGRARTRRRAAAAWPAAGGDPAQACRNRPSQRPDLAV